MKLSVVLFVVCVVVSSEAACNSRPSGIPSLGIEAVQEFRDGKILFEEKSQYILVTRIDKSGDGHIRVLDHAGMSRTQAMEILKQKQAELERAGQCVP